MNTWMPYINRVSKTTCILTKVIPTDYNQITIQDTNYVCKR